MELTFREDYWDDQQAKESLIRFLYDIHNLDLTLWDERGLWDRKYRPFSFFDGDRVVSNVCIYTMDMVVAGRECRVAQVSGVGTHPDYRRKGLSSELTRRAMEWAQPKHDFFYLFADEEAFSLYARFGFRNVIEHKTVLAVEGREAVPGAEKLNIDSPDHFQFIYRKAAEREAVSDTLGIKNKRLLMFWCLYFLRDEIHYINDLDIIVMFSRESGIVTVSDVVGSQIPPFADIYPYISDPADREVHFLFMVDKMNLIDARPVALDGSNGTHLCGDFPLGDSEFILPRTSQA